MSTPTASGRSNPRCRRSSARQGPMAARIKASPLARKLAADAGLDLATISGTGPGGRIVKRDIAAANRQLQRPRQHR